MYAKLKWLQILSILFFIIILLYLQSDQLYLHILYYTILRILQG